METDLSTTAAQLDGQICMTKAGKSTNATVDSKKIKKALNRMNSQTDLEAVGLAGCSHSSRGDDSGFNSDSEDKDDLLDDDKSEEGGARRVRDTGVVGVGDDTGTDLTCDEEEETDCGFYGVEEDDFHLSINAARACCENVNTNKNAHLEQRSDNDGDTKPLDCCMDSLADDSEKSLFRVSMQKIDPTSPVTEYADLHLQTKLKMESYSMCQNNCICDGPINSILNRQNLKEFRVTSDSFRQLPRRDDVSTVRSVGRRTAPSHDLNNNEAQAPSLHSYLAPAPFKLQNCFQEQGLLSILACIVYTLTLMVIVGVFSLAMNSLKHYIGTENLQSIRRHVVNRKRARMAAGAG